MSQSIPPGARPESGKWVVFLLVAGCLMLVAGCVVLFMKRSAPPEEVAVPTPDVPRRVEAPAPLVVAAPSPPMLTKNRDAGPAVAVAKPRTSRRGGSAPAEKMGTIDAKEVNRFMNARFGQVKACYERRLKVNPMLEGKLDLNITVSLKGKVKSISRNRDTLRDDVMWSCVRTAIRSWEFPKPTGGRVVVAKTFNFKKKL